MFKEFSQIGRAMMLPVAIRLVANCRAYAKDGVANGREITRLSTQRFPHYVVHTKDFSSI